MALLKLRYGALNTEMTQFFAYIGATMHQKQPPAKIAVSECLFILFSLSNLNTI